MSLKFRICHTYTSSIIVEIFHFGENPFLQVLSDNKLGRGGGIAMAELILDNRILISLNLSGEVLNLFNFNLFPRIVQNSFFFNEV